MKKIFFQKCNANYFFFLAYITSLFINIIFEIEEYPENIIDEEDMKIYASSEKLLFYYITILSHFIAIIPFLLKKFYFNKTQNIIKENLNLKSEDQSNDFLIYNNINEEELNKRRKKVHLYSFLVSFFNFLSWITTILVYMFNPKDAAEPYCINSSVVFDIILQFSLSYVILKMHFYKLQYFTIILNVIIFIIMLIFDLINIYVYESFRGIIFLIYFFDLMFYAFQNSYGKKAFLYGFISPYDLLIREGLYEILLALIFSVVIIFTKNDIFSVMSFFFSKSKYILYLLGHFFAKFFEDTFGWFIIDRFSPNYLPLALIFEDICYFIAEETGLRESPKYKTLGWDIYIRFFLYIISFIGIMIHNEIIIINICGISSHSKYFMDIKLKNEEIYSGADDPDVLKKYETYEEMDFKSSDGSTKKAEGKEDKN